MIIIYHTAIIVIKFTGKIINFGKVGLWKSDNVEFGKVQLRKKFSKFGNVRLWKSENIKFRRDQSRQLKRPFSATVNNVSQ